ncbi:MAG: DNA-binding protein [Clostridia bacterium BRH_c25]|nr:MAG: DNA-binding protein [Clostridia bacterium BRH_c25]
MDKFSIVKEWLDFANRDISSARYLLGMNPVPLEIVCYHCEQAAEKALKGYLILQDYEPPRTHDLRLLCKMCADIDKTFDTISQSCVNLTPYGIQPRYPFEIEILDSDMQKAVVDADHVMNFVLQKLQLTEEITQDDEHKDQQKSVAEQQLT